MQDILESGLSHCRQAQKKNVRYSAAEAASDGFESPPPLLLLNVGVGGGDEAIVVLENTGIVALLDIVVGDVAAVAPWSGSGVWQELIRI